MKKKETFEREGKDGAKEENQGEVSPWSEWRRLRAGQARGGVPKIRPAAVEYAAHHGERELHVLKLLRSVAVLFVR